MSSLFAVITYWLHLGNKLTELFPMAKKNVTQRGFTMFILTLAFYMLELIIILINFVIVNSAAIYMMT